MLLRDLRRILLLCSWLLGEHCATVSCLCCSCSFASRSFLRGKKARRANTTRLLLAAHLATIISRTCNWNCDWAGKRIFYSRDVTVVKQVWNKRRSSRTCLNTVTCLKTVCPMFRGGPQTLIMGCVLLEERGTARVTSYVTEVWVWV